MDLENRAKAPHVPQTKRAYAASNVQVFVPSKKSQGSKNSKCCHEPPDTSPVGCMLPVLKLALRSESVFVLLFYGHVSSQVPCHRAHGQCLHAWGLDPVVGLRHVLCSGLGSLWGLGMQLHVAVAVFVASCQDRQKRQRKKSTTCLQVPAFQSC